ncbi:MAG TPA: hypothetical protein VF103_06970 [Polyangiaceae bacterium]
MTDRPRFYRAVWLVPALLAALGLASCEKSGVCGGHELLVEVSGNHGHVERIEKKALAKGAGRYALDGGSHEHGFRLTDADVAKLAAGETLELRSTSMNAHLHELRLKCAR